MGAGEIHFAGWLYFTLIPFEVETFQNHGSAGFSGDCVGFQRRLPESRGSSGYTQQAVQPIVPLQGPRASNWFSQGGL